MRPLYNLRVENAYKVSINISRLCFLFGPPHLDGFINTGGGDIALKPGNGGYALVVPLIRVGVPASQRLPDLDGRVLAPRSEIFAIGRPGYGRDGADMTLIVRELLSCNGIPDHNTLTNTTSREISPIRRPCHSKHRLFGGIRADMTPCGGIPILYGIRLRFGVWVCKAGGDTFTIGRPGEVIDDIVTTIIVQDMLTSRGIPDLYPGICRGNTLSIRRPAHFDNRV